MLARHLFVLLFLVPSLTAGVPLSNGPSDEPQCECRYDKVWVDVMLLFDTSVNIGHRNLVEFSGLIKSEIFCLNIESEASVTPFHTRVGIIGYGMEASMTASLGSLTKNWFLETEVPYTGDPYGNLTEAIELASTQFGTPAHRKNARPVIVIATNTYNCPNCVSPIPAVNNFKTANNGIVIVFDFAVLSNSGTNLLQSLASPGYYIRDVDDKNSTLLDEAMCTANCFCPTNTVSKRNDPITNIPVQGCYYSSTELKNQVLSQHSCNKINNGNISSAKSSQKSAFLENEMKVPGTPFWLGMTYDAFNSSYYWGDGSKLTDDWQPWAVTRTANNQQCVYEKNNKWYASTCKPSFNYVCDVKPCSSTVYCE